MSGEGALVSHFRDGGRLCGAGTAPHARRGELSDWNRLEYAESRYSEEEEPWGYSQRGVERLRHERISALARSLSPTRILDLGCSLGQLTRRLGELPTQLVGLDLSPTAVRRAREHIRRSGGKAAQFLAGRSVELPFRDGWFDLIVASDGLYSWALEHDARVRAVREIRRAVSDGGRVIFTEHMRLHQFGEFVGEIRAGGLSIESVSYLYDRPAYQFESWLKAVRHWRLSRALRASVGLARALSAAGRLFGPRGSRHICVVARKA